MGIRLESGAVPAAVCLDKFFHTSPLFYFIKWEGSKK